MSMIHAYPVEGLGKVAAVDSTLSGIDRTRLMSPNKGSRWVAGYFTAAGGVTSCTLRPVYVRQVDEMLQPQQGGALGADTLDADGGDRFEDPSQDVAYTADGNYTKEFRARPGFMTTFKVVALVGGTVTISGQYQAGP